MAASPYESALALAGSLPAVEKLQLIRALLSQATDIPPELEQRSILELRGLGAEVWGRLDAQEYVRHERDSWNG